MVVVASPGLARPAPGCHAPAVVRVAEERAVWPLAEGPSLTVMPVLVLSSLVMIRDAVRTGIGAARLPVSLVAHDLAAGRLVAWGDVAGSDIALWALYPSRRLLSARVSAFLDHLRETFPTGAPEELAAFVADEEVLRRPLALGSRPRRLDRAEVCREGEAAVHGQKASGLSIRNSRTEITFVN